MMLRTTREREVERLVDVVKKKERRKKARKGEQQRQDDGLVATTVFDFAWRMRTRSNCSDPAKFHVGTLSADRAREHTVALRTFTSARMFLFEAM